MQNQRLLRRVFASTTAAMTCEVMVTEEVHLLASPRVLNREVFELLALS